MPDENLLTLKQLAAELGLPESTVRYYRDAFLDHIPSVGTGRRRRYPPQAVAVLRSIARSYAAGRQRSEISRAIGQAAPRNATLAVPTAQAQPQRALEDVSNLDLLAAILDGEREQRDALWQMAKEIVRLSEVLEGQDHVLVEIADRAGVAVPGRAFAAPQPAPALHAPAPAAAPAAPPPPEPPAPAAAAEPPAPAVAISVSALASDTAVPQATAAPTVAWSIPTPSPPPPPLPPPEPTPGPEPAASAPAGGAPDMDKLRSELETERALVARLHQAKLGLERRAADAEAELEHQRTRRSSVIRRLLGAEKQ